MPARSRNGGSFQPGQSGNPKGRPKGSKNKATLRSRMEEDAFREEVKKHLEPILEAQVANAMGIKYIVVRKKKGGKFTRVTTAMAKAREGLQNDEEIIEVWEKDPSSHAFKELLDRAYGKPREPERKITVDLKTYKWGDE